MVGAMPLAASNVNAWKAANWKNGTANGLTPAQNQANAAAPAGMPAASPLVGGSPNGGGMWGAVQGAVNMQKTPLATGAVGIPASATTGGGFVPVGTLGATPNTGGQMPPSSGGNAVPKYDAAGIAASRVAAQRAALAASNAAYDTSRTAAFKYAQGTTQGNRALLQFDNSNRGDQFGGSAREDLFRLQRSQGIEDTAANQAYQNDIAASDAKLAAFDAGAPALTTDYQNQLEQANQASNIALAGVTGQYNGQNTMAQNNANNSNAVAVGGLTGNYTSPATSAIQQQMAKNSAAYATASPEEQNRLHTENMQLASQLGETYNPGSGTYSGGNASQRTLAGQTQDMNNVKDMAVLTGKMPDGTPTNAAQQQELTNQWTVADQTGTIPNSLADFYGLPHGMPTQQAKNQAQQIAVSNRNATNSENSTSNTNNNAKVNQLMEAWKSTGSAPAGLESLGVHQGDKYTGGTTPAANKNNVQSTYVAGLDSLTPEKRAQVFKDEKQAIINDLGISGYSTLYNMYFDQYGAPKQ